MLYTLYVYTVAELSSAAYWKSPFNAFSDVHQLTEFFVIHIEKMESDSAKETDKVRLNIDS